MSDQELRDKLASEYYATNYRGFFTSEFAFKAGWDAARANDEERQGLYAELIGLEHRLGTKAEILERERDQLKAQCEKLAEALESVVPRLQELSKILKDNALDEKQGIAEHDACLIACGFLKGDIEKTLAEYRKETEK